MSHAGLLTSQYSSQCKDVSQQTFTLMARVEYLTIRIKKMSRSKVNWFSVCLCLLANTVRTKMQKLQTSTVVGNWGSALKGATLYHINP